MAGLRPPVRRGVAIAYASNALSVSLPVVGFGTATAYSYRGGSRRGHLGRGRGGSC